MVPVLARRTDSASRVNATLLPVPLVGAGTSQHQAQYAVLSANAPAWSVPPLARAPHSLSVMAHPVPAALSAIPTYASVAFARRFPGVPTAVRALAESARTGSAVSERRTPTVVARTMPPFVAQLNSAAVRHLAAMNASWGAALPVWMNTHVAHRRVFARPMTRMPRAAASATKPASRRPEALPASALPNFAAARPSVTMPAAATRAAQTASTVRPVKSVLQCRQNPASPTPTAETRAACVASASKRS